MKKNRGKGSKDRGQEKLTPSEILDAELNIPQELKAIIEDSESDEEKAMPLMFSDPEDLMEIFSILEEKSLFMIGLCQDIQVLYEEQKQMEKKERAKTESIIKGLKENEE